MKDFNYKNVTFYVDEEWYGNVRVNINEDAAEQVFCQAMSDPENSGLTTDDPAYAEAIKEAAELIQKAKDVNKAHSKKGADIQVRMNEPGTYDILFAAGQLYESGDLKAAKRAIEKLDKYLDHHNVVRVTNVDVEGETRLKKAMELEIFLNNKCHKVISVIKDEENFVVVYIPRGFRNFEGCAEEDYDED